MEGGATALLAVIVGLTFCYMENQNEMGQRGTSHVQRSHYCRASGRGYRRLGATGRKVRLQAVTWPDRYFKRLVLMNSCQFSKPARGRSKTRHFGQSFPPLRFRFFLSSKLSIDQGEVVTGGYALLGGLASVI